jgi:CIC family chloride channel protein
MVEPRSLGMGYENISGLLQSKQAGLAVISLLLWKGISWSVALGSGTSGGTLAPLFTLGGAWGALLGTALLAAWPHCGCEVGMAALVGMAAFFAGASRALLASVVFAFETTHCTSGLLPLLVGCSAAYLVAAWHSSTSIMTEKIARRGVRVADGYVSNHLDRLMVGAHCTRRPVTLAANLSASQARSWIERGNHDHQSYPVVDACAVPLGLVSWRALRDAAADAQVASLIRQPPALIHEDNTLHEAIEHLLAEQVGRLLVVSKTTPPRLTGILSRSDLIQAHAHGSLEGRAQKPTVPDQETRRRWRVFLLGFRRQG